MSINNRLKFIGLMLSGLICFLLWAQVSSALDTRRITGYTEIYGDINGEVRAVGQGTKDTSENEQAFLHYHNLGVRSYIWDPRLVQFNVSGNFYQQISLRDGGDRDFIIYGGSGVVTFFPESFLPLTIRGSREQIIDPQLAITEGGVSTSFLRKGWPGIYLSGSWINYKSDDKKFRQDVDFLNGSASLVYETLLKPIRLRIKENGQNGNGKNGAKKNGTAGEVPQANRLVINATYDYARTEDKLADVFNDEHRGTILIGYFFNNNRAYVLNNTVWTRRGERDSYQDNLTWFHGWSPTFNTSLGGFYAYNTSFFIDKITNTDTQAAGAFLNLSKIFSPQWRAILGAEGHFVSNINKETSWGASGYGGIFSRIFPNFDWGATASGGVNNDIEHKTTSNYSITLTGLYRLTPNKILSLDGNYTYLSGLNGTHGWDGRVRLTFDAVWSADFTLRATAEYRYQDFKGLISDATNTQLTGGKAQSGSFDIYGIYRFTPRTSLFGGVNFTYLNTDSGTDKFVRAYATLSSNPWDSFNYSVTAEYDYAIDGKNWIARVRPQIFYVWRQLYFSLTGEFDYISQTNNATNNTWNYNVTFKISRPFSIRFF